MVVLEACVVVAVGATAVPFLLAAARLLPVRLDRAFLMPAVRDTFVVAVAAFFAAAAVVVPVALLTGFFMIVVPLLSSLPEDGRLWAV